MMEHPNAAPLVPIVSEKVTTKYRRWWLVAENSEKVDASRVRARPNTKLATLRTMLPSNTLNTAP